MLKASLLQTKSLTTCTGADFKRSKLSLFHITKIGKIPIPNNMPTSFGKVCFFAGKTVIVRLRTETAAIVAATAVYLSNNA